MDTSVKQMRGAIWVAAILFMCSGPNAALHAKKQEVQAKEKSSWFDWFRSKKVPGQTDKQLRRVAASVDDRAIVTLLDAYKKELKDRAVLVRRDGSQRARSGMHKALKDVESKVRAYEGLKSSPIERRVESLYDMISAYRKEFAQKSASKVRTCKARKKVATRSSRRDAPSQVILRSEAQVVAPTPLKIVPPAAPSSKIEELRRKLSWMNDSIKEQKDEFTQRIADLGRTYAQQNKRDITSAKVDELQKKVNSISSIVGKREHGAMSTGRNLAAVKQQVEQLQTAMGAQQRELSNRLHTVAQVGNQAASKDDMFVQVKALQKRLNALTESLKNAQNELSSRLNDVSRLAVSGGGSDSHVVKKIKMIEARLGVLNDAIEQRYSALDNDLAKAFDIKLSTTHALIEQTVNEKFKTLQVQLDGLSKKLTGIAEQKSKAENISQSSNLSSMVRKSIKKHLLANLRRSRDDDDDERQAHYRRRLKRFGYRPRRLAYRMEEDEEDEY